MRGNSLHSSNIHMSAAAKHELCYDALAMPCNFGWKHSLKVPKVRLDRRGFKKGDWWGRHVQCAPVPPESNRFNKYSDTHVANRELHSTQTDRHAGTAEAKKIKDRCT